MTEQERLLAALEYQEAQRPALMNPNLMRQGQRMNLPARQAPGPMAEFVTQAMSLDPQPDQGLGTVGAEMGLSLVPGVGQAMGLRDIERGRRANDPVMMGLGAASLIPVGKLINALRGGKQVGPVSELDVYHGSPHRFPPTAKNPLGEFDPTRIGTGEGAQAYGHGLYFAEAPGVAQSYADILPKNAAFDGKPIYEIDTNTMGRRQTMVTAYTHQSNPSGVGGRGTYTPKGIEDEYPGPIAAYKDLLAKGFVPKNAPKWIDPVSGNIEVSSQGANLYKVDLPDEQIAKMLDWDKPLSQQPNSDLYSFFFPPNKVLFAGGQGRIPSFSDWLSSQIRQGNKVAVGDNFPKGLPIVKNTLGTPGLDSKRVTGEQLYTAMQEWLKRTKGMSSDDASKIISEAMAKEKIPGIKYLDQGSRGSQMRRVVDPDSGTSIFHQMKGGETADKALIRLRGKYPKAVIKEVGEDFGTSNFVVFPGGEKMLNILERQ